MHPKNKFGILSDEVNLWHWSRCRRRPTTHAKFLGHQEAYVLHTAFQVPSDGWFSNFTTI